MTLPPASHHESKSAEAAATPKAIGIAVVLHGGRVLVGTRGPDGPLPGYAEFPGGKCEPGEEPIACALRECREETGLEVAFEGLLTETDWDYPHGAVRLFFVRCRPARPDDVAESHQGFRWTPLAGLDSLRFPDANGDVLRTLAALASPAPSDRFEFGANWTRFLSVVDEARIEAAIASLQAMLGVERLDGKTFLDVGSGSGLFSLAAQRLGARVHSFDHDPQSVACSQEMKRRFGSDSPTWTIEQGSALNDAYLAGLPPADVVYSWGVLHHTGQMWRAIDLVSRRVAPGGLLALAIYNDQGRITQRWVQIKQLYQRLPPVLRLVLVAAVGGTMLAGRLCEAALSAIVSLLTLHSPLTPFRSLADAVRRPDPRGMSRWHDLVDWVGGWPFEVARPEEVFEFLTSRGFTLIQLKTCGGRLGCNEFTFRRPPAV